MDFRKILIVFLLLDLPDSIANTNATSFQAAYANCETSAASGSGATRRVECHVLDTVKVSGLYWNLPSNTFAGTWENHYYTGGLACPVGYSEGPKVYSDDIFGKCIQGCQPGYVLVNGQCVSECPAGKVKASSLPQLFTSSDACVDPSIERCDALGFNPNDITPACSQLFEGSPAVCFQSEYPETQLPQCPQLTCEDGSTVTYPTPCPVISCPDGFTLASLGADLGNSCIKELPPEDQPNPDEACITVPGVGSETICADANNTQCGRYNGEYVCLEKKDSPEPGDYCIDKNGSNICLTNQPRIKETYDRTNNPDGSYEETVRRETNIQGDSPSTTTRSCDASGNCVTTSTDTSKEQNLASLKAIEKNTRETADVLSEFRDALKAPDAGFSGETVSGDEGQLYQKTDKTFQSVYQGFWADIQTQPLYQAVLNAFVVSFQSCECPTWESGPVEIMGQTLPGAKFDQLCGEFFTYKVLPVVTKIIWVVSIIMGLKWAFL
ncbi:hypothetical protein [Methylomonas methanica]|uniref:Uncharacterized protein n=1 Tax=Methylomonas methanica (strain DSM 25384 / MC09) TaxID=857087 RepID=F9ZV53_METMM|nr:hypothetical protein [Methylomonas methanica]AEF99486.1 hypothetical protein Metme_1050 [Methylomonas methanica MC09]